MNQASRIVLTVVLFMSGALFCGVSAFLFSWYFFDWSSLNYLAAAFGAIAGGTVCGFVGLLQLLDYQFRKEPANDENKPYFGL